MVNVLEGKLEFLKMVKGENDSTYKSLKGRFDKSAGITNPINTVLNIWEESGIEKAMDIFYKDK